MDKVKCTHCQTDNPVNSKYCSRCGYELPKVQTDNLNTPTPQTAPNKKRLSIKGMIGVAIGVGTMIAVQQIFFKTPSYDKEMMEVASELNKSCPIMVDEITRLDNTIALPNNTFQYNYTLVNTDKATLDTADMKNYLTPTIINFVKTNPQMKIQRDHKTTVNYYYKDKSGQYLFTVSVTPDKYE